MGVFASLNYNLILTFKLFVVETCKCNLLFFYEMFAKTKSEKSRKHMQRERSITMNNIWVSIQSDMHWVIQHCWWRYLSVFNITTFAFSYLPMSCFLLGTYEHMYIYWYLLHHCIQRMTAVNSFYAKRSCCANEHTLPPDVYIIYGEQAGGYQTPQNGLNNLLIILLDWMMMIL